MHANPITQDLQSAAADVKAALKYAAEHCTFPQGSCAVLVRSGNHISDEMIGKFGQLSGKFHITY